MSSDGTGCARHSPPRSLPLLPAPGRNRDTDMPGKTPPFWPVASFQSSRSAPGNGTWVPGKWADPFWPGRADPYRLRVQVHQAHPGLEQGAK